MDWARESAGCKDWAHPVLPLGPKDGYGEQHSGLDDFRLQAYPSPQACDLSGGPRLRSDGSPSAGGADAAGPHLGFCSF